MWQHYNDRIGIVWMVKFLLQFTLRHNTDMTLTAIKELGVSLLIFFSFTDLINIYSFVVCWYYSLPEKERTSTHTLLVNINQASLSSGCGETKNYYGYEERINADNFLHIWTERDCMHTHDFQNVRQVSVSSWSRAAKVKERDKKGLLPVLLRSSGVQGCLFTFSAPVFSSAGCVIFVCILIYVGDTSSHLGVYIYICFNIIMIQ